MISGNKKSLAPLYLFLMYRLLMRQKNISTIVLLAFALLAGCAKQGMPSGGPKDVAPPVQKRTTPENRTLAFDGKEFYIEFDEYVVLKDAENNILVSPPMKQKPEYKTKGRGIQVRINDTLQPNTTYVFQFKDAIADYNEGNLLPSLEYVFSTGSYIDSMTVSGRATDALTGEPREEAMSVWLLTAEQRQTLLRSMNDTSVKAPTPTYATRCDKQGAFSFNYIRPGEYYIVALADEDKNLQIGPSEAIGFADAPTASRPMTDTAATDTAHRTHKGPAPIGIRLFKPESEKQRITGSNFIAAGKVRITTQLPMTSPTIGSGTEPTIWRLNEHGDTLTLWTLREKCDSLQLTVSDPSGIQDTLRLRWRPKKSASTPAAQPNTKLNFSKLPYFDTLALLFTTPLGSGQAADSAVTITTLKDSTVTICAAYPDSTLMKARIDFAFKQGEKYAVTVDKGVFKNIHNQGNDSIRATIEVSKAEDYGNLRLLLAPDTASETAGSVIVELLDEKGTVVKRHKANIGDKVEFANLKPAKYKVRAIVDTDNDGEWTPGDFASQRQPEPSIYYPKTLDVRANWDFEERFIISN